MDAITTRRDLDHAYEAGRITKEAKGTSQDFEELVFVLAGAEHEVAESFTGVLALLKDQFHLLRDGHLNAVLARQA